MVQDAFEHLIQGQATGEDYCSIPQRLGQHPLFVFGLAHLLVFGHESLKLPVAGAQIAQQPGMLDGDRAVRRQHLGQPGVFLGEEARFGFVHRVQADDFAARNQRHAQPTADILRAGRSVPNQGTHEVSEISRLWRDCST